MNKSMLLVVILFLFGGCLFGQSDCYSDLVEKGERQNGAGQYGNAIQQFRAAQGCPRLTDQQKINLGKLIEDTQDRQLKAVKKQQRIAEAAKKEAEEEREIAKAAQEIAEAQTAIAQQRWKITEANRLAFLADQQLQVGGDSLDGLHLAFLAYNSIEDQPTALVKLAFGDAVRANYLKEVGKDTTISILGEITPNGQYVAFPAPGNSFRLWQKIGKEMLAVPVSSQHKGPIRALAFSPDSQYLLSGSEDNTAVLWNVSGSPIQTFSGHTSEITGLTFTPVDRRILTWSRDGTAKLWDFSGRLLANLNQQRGGILSAVFSPDGSTILTRSADRSVMIWDGQGRALGGNGPMTHPGHVYTAVYSPDGQKVLTSSTNSLAKHFSLARGSVDELREHQGTVTSADFSFDSQFLMTGGTDGQVHLRATGGSLSRTFKAHNDWIIKVGFSPVSHHFFTVSKDNMIKLWNLTDKTWHISNQPKPIILKGHADQIISASFLPGGQHLISYSKDGTVKLWDLAGDVIFDYTPAESDLVAAKYAADGSQLLILPLGQVPLIVPNPVKTYQSLKKNPLPPLTTEKLERYSIENGNPELESEIAQTSDFKIQLIALSKPENFDASKVEGMGKIETARIDKLTRFFIGGFSSRAAAERVLPQVKEAGYGKAIIISPPTDNEVTNNAPSLVGKGESTTEIPTAPSLPPTVIEPEPPITPAPVVSPYKIRLVTLSKPENFEKHRNKIASLGSIEQMKSKQNTVFLIGGFQSLAEAKNVLPAARRAGFPDAFVVIDENGKLIKVK